MLNIRKYELYMLYMLNIRNKSYEKKSHRRNFEVRDSRKVGKSG